MLQYSHLCTAPVEILENVALEVALTDICGPTAALTPLLCSCKYINSVLSFGSSNSLYARILKSKFDVCAPRRRFGDQVMENETLAHQLRKYCITLRRIRYGDIFSPYVLETLWTAFLMLLDNDGKNMCQLTRVGLDDFVDRFVRTRVYESRWQNNGWPAENPANALALWILWMMTTQEKLRSEPEHRRQQIINIVLPYVLLSFRYPATYAPPNHYNFPLLEDYERQYPHSVLTVHGPFPLYREPGHISQNLIHFGQRIKISMPLTTIAAKLLYFSRREILPFNIPSHLPVSRAHAIQMGRFHPTPTQDDVIEFNSHTDTKLPARTSWNWWENLTEQELDREFSGVSSSTLKSASSKYDNDWMKLNYCWNPWVYSPGKGTVYTAGMFAGLWQGRMIIPNELAFMQLVSTAEYPPTFSESNPHVSTVPIYMRIREHHCISPQSRIRIGGAADGFDDGFRDAYFPPIHYQQDANNVVIHADGEISRYETFVQGQQNSHDEETCEICAAKSSLAEYDDEDEEEEEEEEEEAADLDTLCSGIRDIIFTGETDERHGQAWNHFTYIGRVRSWDGLITILRIPRERSLGRVIFYGYIVGGQNFVGNWRPAGADIIAPAWESAFTMSRRDD